MIRAPKSRKCKNKACGDRFVPTERHPFAIACCAGCEIILSKQLLAKAQAAREKKERKELKARKEAIKKHGDWEAELQAIVNKYVRARDAGKPCISCGTLRTVRWEAGHYIAVGANNSLRFEPDNIHVQCHRCNFDMGGNHVMYRIGLEQKIGVTRVEWLEGWHPTNKLSVDSIKQMKVDYRAKTKALQATKFEEAA